MAKAVRTAKPTVSDLLATMRERPTLFTPEQREQVEACLRHNDAEPNAKRRIGSQSLCDLLARHYEYRGSRHKLERDVVLEFGRRTWSKP